MPLSWNEIRANAIKFSREYSHETREHAEAKSFWDAFFGVFGIKRRVIASFEEPVKRLSGQYGFIDLFWKGTLLAEHKSGGKDLSKAASQAFQYIQDLVNSGRQDEAPRYVLLSNFQKFILFDLDQGTEFEFSLADLHKHVDKFAFIPGYKQQTLAPEDPINLKAVEVMGRLHDKLEAGGYAGHELERMLVRVLFCLFAEDTGIFSRNAFQLYLENHTAPDGSNLGAALSQFFYVLNTPEDKRQANLLEELAELPYVNGELFSENLGFAAFNREMREGLLTCTSFDWSQISPAVFGALFQSVMEPAERRQIGAHYTSERDILKVIGPLFLDALKEELAAAGTNERKLKALQSKLAGLKLLDPACGCGNFLVIAYRELRMLELEILKQLYGRKDRVQSRWDIGTMAMVDVDQFYGIEIDEWPARIAEVAMWLMDHQMNLKISEEFGNYFVRLPLKKSPHIVCANALRIDWNDVLPAKECSYVFGNPPFIGAKFQSAKQRQEVASIAGAKVKGIGVLDYVTGWYFQSAKYITDSEISVAFVSTNSISQGEQPGILWGELFIRGLQIIFAHRTFTWQSDARNAAHVHVVIIGFARHSPSRKRIYEYESTSGLPTEYMANNINQYLIDGSCVPVLNRTTPIDTQTPKMRFGNQPIDGGHLLLTHEDYVEAVGNEPEIAPLIRKFIGSREFINSEPRFCLWLKNADVKLLRRSPFISKRLKLVSEFRQKSGRLATRQLAATPGSFAFVSHEESEYMIVPSVSSERRNFIPIGFMPASIIASNLCLIIPNGNKWHFGVLQSTQHMAWMRTVCGRLESRYRYSAKLVYNNFPWPQDVSDKQRELVEAKAQAVLDARLQFPDATLADLYDPLTMPAALTKAHQELDRAVDKCFRPQPFTSERQRVEYLFKLYEELTRPLVTEKKARTKKPKPT